MYMLLPKKNKGVVPNFWLDDNLEYFREAGTIDIDIADPSAKDDFILVANKLDAIIDVVAKICLIKLNTLDAIFFKLDKNWKSLRGFGIFQSNEISYS